MRGVVVPSQNVADALMSRLDVAMGLPKPPTVYDPTQIDITTPGPGWTLHATETVTHPTNGHLAVLVPSSIDDTYAAVVTAASQQSDATSQSIAMLGSAAELSSDWEQPAP